MKTAILSLIISFGFSVALFSQSYSELINEASKLYQEEEYAASKEKYQEAFELEDTRNYFDLYNGACSSALAGDKKTALKMLTASVEKGWKDVRHMKGDSDLNLLHSTKKWKKIVAEVQATVDEIEAKYNKPLQAELLAIYEDDQGVRREFSKLRKKLGWDHPTVDSLGKIMNEKDEINLVKIEKILDEHGWVGADLVGNQANTTIFLVIQHSELETQQKYLPMMREAVEKGNARGSSLALLEDRVALREGRKQIYGSQIGNNPETKEKYVLPLEDPDKVDERRKSVGLGPIAEYISNWDLEWDVEEYKKRLPEYEEWNKK